MKKQLGWDRDEGWRDSVEDANNRTGRTIDYKYSSRA